MNSFGRLFRVSVFGESHGSSLGCLIDGCPQGIKLSAENFIYDINRRKSRNKWATARTEEDIPELLSGIYKGYTTGAPIAIGFRNKDTRSYDYKNIIDIPRPGHADFTGRKKFDGYNDPRGGGHFSGRLTLALVAGGVIAKKTIDHITSYKQKNTLPPIDIKCEVHACGKSDKNNQIKTDFLLDEIKKAGDSAGGIITCTIKNMPAGLGEPFFDTMESLIAHIMFAIPGVKGIEFGAGFKTASMRGSEYNDPILDKNGMTLTNNAGGINGGITNGNDICFAIAVHPTASISKPQKTFNFKKGEIDTLAIEGRHDVCFALRVPPVVESAAAIVIADCLLLV